MEDLDRETLELCNIYEYEEHGDEIWLLTFRCKTGEGDVRILTETMVKK